MKKLILVIILTLTLIIIPTACISSPKSPTVQPSIVADSIQGSMVQVVIPKMQPEEADKIAAFGVVVGDGSQVLTCLNYEEYDPGSLEIIWPDHGKYNASIQTIDPRTSATLLKLESTKLPTAKIGDTSMLKQQQQIFILGWISPEYNSFEKSSAIITPNQINSSLFFSASYTEEAIKQGKVDNLGAIVADEKDNVFGLETSFYNKLILIAGNPRMIPPIININYAIGLLSPDATSQPWANGPVITALANQFRMVGYSSGILPAPSNYDQMTIALQNLIIQLGDSTTTDDLKLNNGPWFRSLDGTLLIAVYPRPIELRNIEGERLAQAKWIGIDWDRQNGNPNRLVYGNKTYVIDGGFVVNGDIADLKNAVGIIPKE